jgi:hypothetical protein
MIGIARRFRSFSQSPIGERIAVAILFLYLIYAQLVIIRHILHELPLWQCGVNPGRQYEERMNRLRPFLPSSGIVGYISDTGEEHYIRSQYSLAPVILVRTPGPRLIVANFSGASMRPEIINGKHYRIIKDFNDGVALIYLDS